MSVETLEHITPEAVIGRVIEDLSGAIGVLAVEAGTRLGLWAALAGAGPTDAGELAARTGVAHALAREWLRTQAAAGYLHYDAGADTFELSDAAAAALLHGPGLGMVSACVEMLAPMASTLDDFVTEAGAGHGLGWHRRGSTFWHGSDALTQVALPSELVAGFLDAAGISERLAGGGSILDVGCGYGSPTLAMAQHLPAVTVRGVDYNEQSVLEAQARSRAAGLDDRVRFTRATATELPPAPETAGYDLITFVDALHDFGDPVGALSAARAHLAPGGSVLLVEFAAGDHVSDNLHPMGRMFYAVSTLICTPNAVSQQVDGSEPLGTLAGPAAIAEVARRAGYTDVRWVPSASPMNIVVELR